MEEEETFDDLHPHLILEFILSHPKGLLHLHLCCKKIPKSQVQKVKLNVREHYQRILPSLLEVLVINFI